MKKNILRAITIIALVFGAFGLTLGYLAMTKPETIDPILLLMQIPGEQQEAYPSGTVKQYSFVVSPSGASYGYTPAIYITRPTTLISVWVKLNESFPGGDYDVYLYLDTAEIVGAYRVDPALFLNVADNGWHTYQDPEIDLPYDSGFQNYFRIGIYNQLTGGERDFIVIVQVVEYS